HRADLEHAGSRVFEALEGLSAPDPAAAPRAQLFERCFESLEKTADREHGGFGTAPKFPSIANLDFLMRDAVAHPAHAGDARALALRQLEAMRAGGIHDQLGGGFHRYSTDREWLVPHFEKMLYDQAQIAWACLEA